MSQSLTLKLHCLSVLSIVQPESICEFVVVTFSLDIHSLQSDLSCSSVSRLSHFCYLIFQLLWRKWGVLYRPWGMLVQSGSCHPSPPPKQLNLLLSTWPLGTLLPLRVQVKWRRVFFARCAWRTSSHSSNSKDTTRRSTQTIVRSEGTLKVSQTPPHQKKIISEVFYNAKNTCIFL